MRGRIFAPHPLVDRSEIDAGQLICLACAYCRRPFPVRLDALRDTGLDVFLCGRGDESAFDLEVFNLVSCMGYRRNAKGRLVACETRSGNVPFEAFRCWLHKSEEDDGGDFEVLERLREIYAGHPPRYGWIFQLSRCRHPDCIGVSTKGKFFSFAHPQKP